MAGYSGTPLTRSLVAVAIAAALATTGCGRNDPSRPSGEAIPTVPGFGITSDAFFDGSPIPARFTCDGKGLSPSLMWAGVPAGTSQLRLVVEDPDAPGGTYTHWDVREIATKVTGFGEGAVPALPAGVVAQPWRPPCPPEGDEPHRYLFRLYANATDGTPVAEARLLGTYER